MARAIRRCKEARCFDAIWVNSEHEAFAEIAAAEGVQFHKRLEALADNVATSEDFVREFLERHECERVFQVHSIAPLLTSTEIGSFVAAMEEGDYDTLLSCTLEQIECAYRDQPINFSFDVKTNSQDLQPIQRISWSITGWRCSTYLAQSGTGAATYSGRVGFFPVSRLAGHIIKTEDDLRMAEALLPLVSG